MVVIPTLNEADHLPDTLAGLKAAAPLSRVFVADCNSQDGTVARARDAGSRVVTGPSITGRGTALRAGTDAALRDHPDAEVVWFLHADSLPPDGALDAIAAALDNPSVVGGAFTQRFNTTGVTWGQRRLLRFAAFCNRLRYRFSRVYFGDQGIFVRAAALKQIGGVPDGDLFEDVDLCRRLRGLGQMVLLQERMTTSPRRFLANGVIRQLLADLRMLWRHRRGADLAEATRRYNALNHAAS